MRVAITGATGSLGGALIQALRAGTFATRVVAVSRDEVKSGDLAERYADWTPLKCVLADVRDPARLEEVFRGCDVVVHAAALKRVGHSVYSPGEMVKTNISGTVNVIHAATEAGVGHVVVVSSDKAVEATNLYGMTKAVAECYAVQANSYSIPRGTRVACVRYGNVLGSRGSVVYAWREQLRRGAPLTLTHPEMTRFVITLPEAARFVMNALDRMEGGEVFIPLLPAARVADLASAVEWQFCGVPPAPARRREYVGLRPGGEKLHESLVSREEPVRTYRVADGVVAVYPTHHSWRAVWQHDDDSGFAGEAYSSDRPRSQLAVGDLLAMLQSKVPL